MFDFGGLRMALADYYECDGCGCKTFYDADLQYDGFAHNPETGKPWPDGNVGFMLVLCKDCVEEYEVSFKKCT